jgi:hypothetical protein
MDRKPKSKEIKPERSGSSSGFHFYNLYQCCERKAFIRFGPPRLEPIFVATPLLAGSAFHAGKAQFYRSEKEKSAIELVKSEIKFRKSEFENREEYLSALDRTPSMLQSWIHEWGFSDLRSLNIVDVERAIKVPFPGRPGWYFTMRLDMLAEDKYDNTLIFETKTSSWSIKSTLINIQYGDQVTGYWWGVEKKYHKKVTAVVPDITFLSSNARDTTGVKNVRGDFVYREQRDIDYFSRSMSQKANEITQKMKAVYSGHDAAIFSRNSYYCNAYNRPCEFAEICRDDLSAKTKVPSGFRRRPGKFTLREIVEPCDDNIAGG